MTIIRYPGKAVGRSESVEHNGIIYTAVIAPDLSADFKSQTPASTRTVRHKPR